MEDILKFIAETTGGESYHTSKIELEVENSSAQIDYDTPEEIVLKHAGETRPPKNYLSLKNDADKISGTAQILNYFLDGSRRIYKIDDIAYLNGSRKMIYPIIAGQIVAGCCRRTDKKLHCEKFFNQVVLSMPDVTNNDGHYRQKVYLSGGDPRLFRRWAANSSQWRVSIPH